MKKVLILLFIFVSLLFSQSETIQYKQWNIEKWNYIENGKNENLLIFKAPCISKKDNPNENNELWIIFDKNKNQFNLNFYIDLYKSNSDNSVLNQIEIKNIEYFKINLDNKSIPIKNFEEGLIFININNVNRKIINDIQNSKKLSYELKLKNINYSIIRTFDIQYFKDLIKDYHLKL